MTEGSVGTWAFHKIAKLELLKTIYTSDKQSILRSPY